MVTVVLSLFFVAAICRSAFAELLVQIKIDATVKCEAHKNCEAYMDLFTSWGVKEQWTQDIGKMWDLYGHETTKHVRWDDGLNGGDSYYLKIIHSCPCSNVTSGDPCNARPAMLCIDLEDRLKTMSPNEKTLAFNFGEVDLSAPWKYYYCPDYDEGINTPCAP